MPDNYPGADRDERISAAQVWLMMVDDMFIIVVTIIVIMILMVMIL